MLKSLQNQYTNYSIHPDKLSYILLSITYKALPVYSGVKVPCDSKAYSNLVVQFRTVSILSN